MAWRVIVRSGPSVDRMRFDSLDAAMSALEARCREVAEGPPLQPVTSMTRTFTPTQRVAARGELRGPRRLSGGVDVRGDGTSEAYVGRVRRRLITMRPKETAYDALRRALSDASSTSAGP